MTFNRCQKNLSVKIFKKPENLEKPDRSNPKFNRVRPRPSAIMSPIFLYLIYSWVNVLRTDGDREYVQ